MACSLLVARRRLRRASRRAIVRQAARMAAPLILLALGLSAASSAGEQTVPSGGGSLRWQTSNVKTEPIRSTSADRFQARGTSAARHADSRLAEPRRLRFEVEGESRPAAPLNWTSSKPTAAQVPTRAQPTILRVNAYDDFPTPDEDPGHSASDSSPEPQSRLAFDTDDPPYADSLSGDSSAAADSAASDSAASDSAASDSASQPGEASASGSAAEDELFREITQPRSQFDPTSPDDPLPLPDDSQPIPSADDLFRNSVPTPPDSELPTPSGDLGSGMSTAPGGPGCNDYEKECRRALRELQERDITTVYVGLVIEGTEGSDYPCDCRLGRDFEAPKFAGRDFSPTLFTWKASGTCHKPLYFEDVQLERYGHTWNPFVQPFVSGAHFFVSVPLLPYKMGLTPPGECMYTLGYYRPGSCAPFFLEPIPLSLRGAVFEAFGAAAFTFWFWPPN